MSAINHPALWAALQRGNSTEVAEQLFPRALDSSAIPARRHPGTVKASLPQKGSTDDAGPVGVDILESQYRARIRYLERVITETHDHMRAERWDAANDLVREAYTMIHGLRL